MKASLYVHFPYCAGKCGYCSFYSASLGVSPADSGGIFTPWLEAVENEARMVGRRIGGFEPVTLFIGGGTPSLLGTRGLEAVVRLAGRLGLPEGAEVSFEANPDDLIRQGPSDLFHGPPAGVTRVSVGVQTFDDGLLKFLGRRHDGASARRALEVVSSWGINTSADLIFAIPGQKMTGFMADVEAVLAFGGGHLSLYDLHLEEGVPLADRPVSTTEEEELREAGASMYSWACRRLAGQGLKRYEVSNFSRPGQECRHNLAYWSDAPYIGLGPGAHSYAAGMRWANEPDLGAYLRRFGGNRSETDSVAPRGEGAAAAGIEGGTVLSREEHLVEFMIMGLRKVQGIDSAQFEKTFGTTLSLEWGPVLENLAGLGLVRYDSGGVRMTKEGFSLGNQVFSAFV